MSRSRLLLFMKSKPMPPESPISPKNPSEPPPKNALYKSNGSTWRMRKKNKRIKEGIFQSKFCKEIDLLLEKHPVKDWNYHLNQPRQSDHTRISSPHQIKPTKDASFPPCNKQKRRRSRFEWKTRKKKGEDFGVSYLISSTNLFELIFSPRVLVHVRMILFYTHITTL